MAHGKRKNESSFAFAVVFSISHCGILHSSGLYFVADGSGASKSFLKSARYQRLVNIIRASYCHTAHRIGNLPPRAQERTSTRTRSFCAAFGRPHHHDTSAQCIFHLTYVATNASHQLFYLTKHPAVIFPFFLQILRSSSSAIPSDQHRTENFRSHFLCQLFRLSHLVGGLRGKGGGRAGAGKEQGRGGLHCFLF